MKKFYKSLYYIFIILTTLNILLSILLLLKVIISCTEQQDYSNNNLDESLGYYFLYSIISLIVFAVLFKFFHRKYNNEVYK